MNNNSLLKSFIKKAIEDAIDEYNSYGVGSNSIGQFLIYTTEKLAQKLDKKPKEQKDDLNISPKEAQDLI